MPFEKVLIVEDEPVVRNLLQEIFTRRKFSVTMAETLAQAEAITLKESFDLVMLDIRLPDGDASKTEFGRLHGASTTLMMLTLVAGAGLVWMEMKDG